MLNYYELCTSISSEFLTKPLPKGWESWGIEAVEMFVKYNVVERFEHFDHLFVLNTIRNIADIVAHDQFGD